MEYIISKEITVLDPTQQVKDYVLNNLVVNNPDYVSAIRGGRYTGNIDPKIYLYKSINGDLVLPFGTLQSLWNLKEKDTTYKTKFNAFKAIKLETNVKLYDYQKRALNRLKTAKNGVLESPCGSGKTNIGLMLIKELGFKALWLTHTHKLLEQSKGRAESLFGKDDTKFGTITEGRVNIGSAITFATVQTMRMLDKSIYENEFDVVVVDECHHCVGSPTKLSQFYKVVNNIKARYKFGLSATLVRQDGLIKCVYALLGPKIHTITEKEVGDKIIKAKHEKVDIDIDYKITDYCGYDGMLDFNKLINTLSTNKERNDIIVSNIESILRQNKRQIVLCHRITQIDEISRLLALKNISSIKITGSVKNKDRKYNSPVIIATYQLAKEGLDIPELDVCHFATPNKDKIAVIQSAGRVERNIDGKEQPIIYDYVDNKIAYCVNAYNKRKNMLKEKKLKKS